MFKHLLSLFSLCIMCYRLTAQSNNAPSDNVPQDLKISGYFQFQYQKASKPGISSFAGGDFGNNTDNRFIIRRGRIKLERTDKFTNIAIQIDATQDAVVLREGFIQVKDPKSKTFMLTAGQFKKPFGYALIYSSSLREFPERPRFYQTLMPSEVDMGAMLTVQPKNYKFLQYDIGLFNGSGMNARDYDRRKDISTSLKFNFNNTSKALTAGFGISYYNGFVRQNTITTYNNGLVSGKPGFLAKTSPDLAGSYAKREYKGINLQLDHHGILGKTSLKAEYVKGQQPGVAPSASIKAPLASRSFSTQPLTDIYNRKFSGFFVWLVKEIPKTKLELIANYDLYDPNTYVNGRDIGIAGNNTTAADIRYETFGGGIIYYMSTQIKFVIYYDHPVNEKTNLSGYNDDLSDNVFTLRAQYRF